MLPVWIFAGLALAQAPVTEEAPDPALGRRLFDSQCAVCHGQDGRGGRGPSLARRLRHAPDEETLREVIRSGLPGGEMPAAWQLSPREVAGVAAYVRSLGTVAAVPLPGDAARGAQTYAKQGCAGCHIIEGHGSGFGPELTGIGARRSADYLRESLTQPAAAFPEDFLLLEAVTADLRTVRGIRLNEDSFTVQLKDARQAFHSFRKADLRELRKLFHESPMPSYASALSAAELDDLVAYLAGLRGKP
jgi:putative heme-binding domain-containing protein